MPSPMSCTKLLTRLPHAVSRPQNGSLAVHFVSKIPNQKTLRVRWQYVCERPESIGLLSNRTRVRPARIWWERMRVVSRMDHFD
jgi:hypothetical protein